MKDGEISETMVLSLVRYICRQKTFTESEMGNELNLEPNQTAKAICFLLANNLVRKKMHEVPLFVRERQ
ncbi:MAG: hypothetical protein COU90_02190 [Candidatus Ryanbacteria bacterium CG10_big_fil_rev_8_21_14_0_10_43_42]|uniref:MarR family transcriptional regulator n=1 Tax=Candidatus Ryanbacteria bacterium CG10_big_fil_rev_8_21_14_0_10_43_42 TaxID=1974864 RepID=A0A2M8KXG5_9BACT|nr:MAG: hypothetical protein COU90_02190 [Candidatus Ryanbacteria bacterium CG10_big_fil_rev_8_21_14_0_10_43_42]